MQQTDIDAMMRGMAPVIKEYVSKRLAPSLERIRLLEERLKSNGEELKPKPAEEEVPEAELARLFGLAVQAELALLEKYDPDQPRDDAGRWSETGGGGGGGGDGDTGAGGTGGKYYDFSKELGPAHAEFYHGTSAEFEEFDPESAGNVTGAPSAETGIWLTNDETVAANWAEYAVEQAGGAPRVVNALPKVEKVKVFDVVGTVEDVGLNESDYDSHYDFVIAANELFFTGGGGQDIRVSLATDARAQGYEAILFKNIIDDPGSLSGRQGIINAQLVVFDPGSLEVKKKSGKKG